MQKRPHPSAPDRPSMDKMATQAVEEVRMVLPGIQALFGFQLTAVFNATSAASSLFHFFRPPTTDRFELRSVSMRRDRQLQGSALSFRFSHEARDCFRPAPTDDLWVLAREKCRADKKLLDLLSEALGQVRCAFDRIHALVPERNEDQSRIGNPSLLPFLLHVDDAQRPTN